MKRNFRIIFAVASFLMLANAAHAFPAQFLGVWRNVNPNSNGLVRLVVSAVPAPGTGLQVQAFGACTPTPCNIGVAQLRTYGQNISDLNHRAATAHYDLSFKDIDIVGHLSGSRHLNIQHFNYFTDASNRQNYWKAERFRKLTALEAEEEFHSTNAEPEQ